jgi:hypothetical protein
MGMANMKRLATLFVVLMASARVSAQEVTFSSIQRGKSAIQTGQWMGRDVWAPDRITNVTNPSYPGTSAVYRFVVKPGDKVGGWSGERAEFSGIRTAKGMLLEDESSGTQYYALSVYIPSGWKAPQVDASAKVAWGTFLQLHGPLGFLNSPPISIDLIHHYTLSVRGGNADLLGDWHGKIYELKDGGAIRFDQWEDFVLMIKFASDDKGEVRLWRRTKGVLTNVFELVGVPTLVFKPSVEAKAPTPTQRRLAGAHYWKQGFYRSTSPNVTTTLYQTGLVRASTFDAAAIAAFGHRERSLESGGRSQKTAQ